jgi:hypothetical protein
VRTSSCKAKGRRACAELKANLLLVSPDLSPDDIIVTSSGDTGEDLKLSPLARKLIPFTFEVKNQESLNIWASLKQASDHSKKSGHAPALAFRRNNSAMFVALTIEDFTNLLRNLYEKTKNPRL